MEKLIGLLFTKGRHNNIIRSMKYLKRYRFPIIILDGSDEPLDASIFASINNIQYFNLPGSSGVERLEFGIKNTKSKYILAMADDDLFLPNAIKKCVNFLDKNADYVAAQGYFWITKIFSSYNPMLERFSFSIHSSDICGRINRHLRNYSHTFYAVHRRNVFADCIENMKAIGDCGFAFIELAQSFTTIGSGKVKRLLNIYCVRTPNTIEKNEMQYRNEPRSWNTKNSKEYCENKIRFIQIIVKGSPFDKYNTEKIKHAFMENIDCLLRRNALIEYLYSKIDYIVDYFSKYIKKYINAKFTNFY